MKDILTEDEAKQRWCPMMRDYHLSDDHPVTVTNTKDRCIAGECMAWRLAHKDDASGQERGYCGAFGLPRFT